MNGLQYLTVEGLEMMLRIAVQRISMLENTTHIGPVYINDEDVLSELKHKVRSLEYEILERTLLKS